MARTSNFGKLWTALSVSLLGSQITALALPLFAATRLHEPALQMGVLASAGQLPFLLCSLPAGILADRVRRRPILIVTDLGSAVLLLTVPLAVPVGGPYFIQLCVVAFGVGVLTVLSEVAHYAYVPTLVARDRLTDFNSRLQVSYSVAESGGPGLAGVLVQLITAPLAVLVDAASFVVSATLLRSIDHQERRVEVPAGEPVVSLRRSLTDGLRMLLGHRLLRPIMLTGLFVAFFDQGIVALFVLYATRELGLNAATIGLIFVAGGIGGIPGAMLARWAGNRYGVGPAIVLGLLLTALSGLLIPLASGPVAVTVLMLAVAKALGGLTFTVANIHQWSLRQAVTPDELAGRVTAGQRFIVYGGGSLGALTGGALGSLIGLRPALFFCVAGGVLAPLITAFSPVRQVREQPALDVEPVQQADLTRGCGGSDTPAIVQQS
ncbi:MAG TPA: MFS transporter [Jatrophihabitans sp.]|nr:MFS transporter [Jatrophihabitans sp.]